MCQSTADMDEIIEVCGLEARGLTEGSSSPPVIETQENVHEFVGLVSVEEQRGETPGREDLTPDPLEMELNPSIEKTQDQKTFVRSPHQFIQMLLKLEESRSMQKQVKVLQKQQNQVLKEKIHLQSEHSKAEENAQRFREYEERRKEAMVHFQITLNEIEAQMEQHNSHNTKLRQENMELAEKLKKLIKQYELREEHTDNMFKHKELQQQLMDDKLQRTAELMRKVEEKQQREREFLLKNATESRHKCEMMKEQEHQLKQQLTLYMDKFEEFQTTLAKSNEVFTTFRQEMEKVS
ncbi:hypothetical protein DNTS_004806 [Danionella cerebrum]|uniref:Uncharacterized protein n=1 Tax=Danionella cerebrum TaxID=2873325 RepID=A0A553R937_9TELE|nr:hypothetical protein DNTS_004806 [Danionella translucida]